MAMEPVSNVDRVVLLLRQRLEERERVRKGRPDQPQDAGRAPATGGLGALAAPGGIDDKTLRRTFIQTLLAEQFGKELINDAQFQQVVARVTEAIETDPVTARLLSRLLDDLRARGALSTGAPRS
ncbi:MAG: hypothetical protein LBV50_09810 [Novosphingobium sp.]|jgi:hypothetical protein|nr:hypothetical protein [Novosphingobium sp.]